MGILDVVLETAVQSVVEESVIERNVRLSRFFPLEIRVGVCLWRHAGNGLVAERVARAAISSQKNQRGVWWYGRISSLAPAGTQPQLAERSRLHERLLAKA